METPLNGTSGFAQTDIGREVERLFAQMHGEQPPQPSTPEPEPQTPDPYSQLSDDERNWLQWKDFLQRDPQTALTHLAQALGVETPTHAQRAPDDDTEPDNPLDYLDDDTRRAVETLIQQTLQPYQEQLQMLAAAAQLFYGEQLQQAAAQQIRQLHQNDAPLIGDLTENDIAEIVQIAAERFNWNLEDAYNFWSAPRIRARLQQRAQPREIQPQPTGQLSPGDLVRALAQEMKQP